MRSIGAHLASLGLAWHEISSNVTGPVLRNYVMSPLVWEPSSQSCPVFGPVPGMDAIFGFLANLRMLVAMM